MDIIEVLNHYLENVFKILSLNIYFFKRSTDGNIQGAYDPSADGLTEVIAEEVTRSSSNSSSTAKRRRRRAVTSLTFRGLSNPTICLTHGSHMIWRVSNSDYPKYDKTNLYNTNPSFDDGPFKALEEKHELESTSFELFAYRFDTEGVYVFISSANPESTMVSLDLIYLQKTVKMFHSIVGTYGEQGRALACHWCGVGSIPARCPMWFEFVVGLCLAASERFSPSSPVFLPPQKPTSPIPIPPQWKPA